MKMINMSAAENIVGKYFMIFRMTSAGQACRVHIIKIVKVLPIEPRLPRRIEYRFERPPYKGITMRGIAIDQPVKVWSRICPEMEREVRKLNRELGKKKKK